MGTWIMRCCWTLLVVPVVNRMQRAWSPSRPSYRLLEISSRCFNGWFRIWDHLRHRRLAVRNCKCQESRYVAFNIFHQISHMLKTAFERILMDFLPGPGIALGFEKFWAFAWQRPYNCVSLWLGKSGQICGQGIRVISFESQGLGCFMYRSLLLTAGIPISDRLR